MRERDACFNCWKRISPDYRITLLTFLEFDDEMGFLPQVEALCERVIAYATLASTALAVFPLRAV